MEHGKIRQVNCLNILQRIFILAYEFIVTIQASRFLCPEVFEEVWTLPICTSTMYHSQRDSNSLLTCGICRTWNPGHRVSTSRAPCRLCYYEVVVRGPDHGAGNPDPGNLSRALPVSSSADCAWSPRGLLGCNTQTGSCLLLQPQNVQLLHW